MTSINHKECIFRQLEENPEDTPPIVARVMDAFTEDGPETLVETAETITALEAPVCDVKSCKISILSLAQYVLSAGNDESRQNLDRIAAPSCAILDVPHAAEEALGPYIDPDDPRMQNQ